MENMMIKMHKVTRNVSDDDRELYRAIALETQGQNEARFACAMVHAEQLARESGEASQDVMAGLGIYMAATAIMIAMRPATTLDELRKKAELVAHYQNNAADQQTINVRDMLTAAVLNDMKALGIDPEKPFHY